MPYGPDPPAAARDVPIEPGHLHRQLTDIVPNGLVCCLRSSRGYCATFTKRTTAIFGAIDTYSFRCVQRCAAAAVAPTLSAMRARGARSQLARRATLTTSEPTLQRI